MSTKQAYQQKLQAQLDEWSAEIGKLQAKGDQVSADARIEYDRQVQELRTMQAEARRKMGELKNAGDDAWQDLKAGIEHAWNDLGRATKSAAARFR